MNYKQKYECLKNISLPPALRKLLHLSYLEYNNGKSLRANALLNIIFRMLKKSRNHSINYIDPPDVGEHFNKTI